MPHLTLDLPPDELRVNRTRGRSYLSWLRAKDEYKEACWMAALTQQGAWRGKAVEWPADLRSVVFLGKRQRCDPSDFGSWFKAGIDALVQFGVFPDDNASRFRSFKVTVGRDWVYPRVELYWGASMADAALAEAMALHEPVTRITRTRKEQKA